MLEIPHLLYLTAPARSHPNEVGSYRQVSSFSSTGAKLLPFPSDVHSMAATTRNRWVFFLRYVYISLSTFICANTSFRRKLLRAATHFSFDMRESCDRNPAIHVLRRNATFCNCRRSLTQKLNASVVGKMFTTCTLFLGIFFCECFADFTEKDERPRAKKQFLFGRRLVSPLRGETRMKRVDDGKRCCNMEIWREKH